MEPRAFGSCRVVEKIATGHLTEVFRAVQDPLDRAVAVKALKPAISPSSPFADALTREARVLSFFSHDNLPRLLAFAQNERDMWLTMEFVDGFSLRAVLDAAPTIDVPAVVAIGLEVARALAHAHERGVIHCAVRPSNILISKDGHVVLTDFGAAQVESLPSSPEPVDGETSLAEPAYMSPEQILGEQLDPRSDIFLLGVVMYEMLAGMRPFEASDGRTLAHAIRQDEPVALDTRAPKTPRPLVQIVATCLQKLPPDRYGSARELCSALEAAFSSLASHPRRHVIATALARARLIERPPPTDEDLPDLLGPATVRPSIVPAVRMLLIMLALIVVGGAVIHFVFRTDEDSRSAAGRGPLELVPGHAGSLRVLARPWAHVVVDGQLIETTPFAQPIPLSQGVHHVTLKHPNAPDERRVVRIASGERVVLDVTMQVRQPPKPPPSATEPPPSSSSP
jgi:serine/threonine-protein kinase